MFWNAPKIWKGGECWIIGGGLSMPFQFGVPEQIVFDVIDGKKTIGEYSKYLKPLHSKNVIGVNVAFLLGEWISALWFCDWQFYKTYRREIHDFKNLKVTDASEVRGQPNIKVMHRSDSRGLSFKPDTINWNKNSGAAAINLAVLMGAKKIRLLGFDMNPDELRHWHGKMKLYEARTSIMNFKVWGNRFNDIARDAKAAGIEILNVNPNSHINDFRKVHIREVL